MTRTRSRLENTLLSGGKTYRTDGVSVWSEVYQASIAKGLETCVDTVHSGPPYLAEDNLSLAKTQITRRSQLTITKSYTGTKRFEKFDPSVWTGTIHMDGGIIFAQDYVNRALASLNPNVPQVDLANFLYELREIPRTLQETGRALAGGANPGSAYLNYRFGWATLMSDLSKLIHLHDAIESEREHLAQVRRKKSVRGNLGVESSTYFGPAKTFTSNPGEFLVVRDLFKAERKVWFTARAEPDFTAPYFGESKADSFRRALGAQSSVATLWNALPWTWLGDYFMSVGSYLDATRGILPFATRSLNIMIQDTIKATQEVDNHTVPGPISFVSGIKKTVRKQRLVYPVPKARVSFRLNPILNHLDILSALAVSKIR